MTLNVNSNSAAVAALQALNRTTDNLATTNARVSSGLQVASAKDNASVYAVAQAQRADIANLVPVTDGLNRAQSISDVAVAAGQSVSDLLATLRQKVLAATDNTNDANTQAALNADFKSTLTRIQQTISAATFNGSNLLDGSNPSGLKFIANADASATITLASQNLSIGGSIITLTAASSVATITSASALLALVDNSIANVNAAVANIGSQNAQVGAHASFITTLSTTLTTGVGGLVDADVAAESARLTALQVQQQLGAQALSIANQSSSIILSLFKSN